MEKFKFDFSKPAEQAEFEKLSSEEKSKQIEITQNQANEMKRGVDNGEAKDYQAAFEKIEKEKTEFLLLIRSKTLDFFRDLINNKLRKLEDNIKIIEKIEQVWPTNIDKEIDPKEKTGRNFGDFWEPVAKIEKIIQQHPEILKNFDKKTTEIPTNELESHLALRFQILTLFKNLTQSFEAGYIIGNTDRYFLDISQLSHECAIQLGSYMLAPDSSTENFLEILNAKKILEGLQEKKNELDKVANLDSQSQQKAYADFLKHQKENYLNYVKKFLQKYGGWHDQKVLEFGGYETVSKLEKIGAIKNIIDAGNSGYTTLGYSVNDENAIINLSNYQEQSKINDTDMICSANTLDWESGIELMAKKPFWAKDSLMATQTCRMAMDELALIFYSQLKKKGFMIHDEMGLPNDLCKLIGIEKIAQFTYSGNLTDNQDDIRGDSWNDESLHFYQKTTSPKVKTLIIGNKIATYNESKDIWEQNGERHELKYNFNESDLTNLSVDEFALCAKRDIEYSDKDFSFDIRTGKRIRGRLYLTRDGFRVNCESTDVNRLLEILYPIELAFALSTLAKNKPAVWQEILKNCKNENDRKSILKIIPEQIKKEVETI